MSETTEQPKAPNTNDAVQHLINTWDRRPRHQLDFSMLTEESRQDCLWIADVLQALIPSMRVIAEKFEMIPQEVIMLDLPPLSNGAGPTTHPDDKNGQEHVPEAPGSNTEECKHERVNQGNHPVEGFMVVCLDCGKDLTPAPTQSDQPKELGAGVPSTPQEHKPATGSNSGIPKIRRRKGRKRKVRGQKRGKSDKFSSALAKAGVTLAVPAPETLPAPTPPAPVSGQVPVVNLGDPPAPKLGPIGES